VLLFGYIWLIPSTAFPQLRNSYVIDVFDHPLGIITEESLLAHLQFAPQTSFLKQLIAPLYKSPPDLLGVINADQKVPSVMISPIPSVQKGTAPRDVLRLMLENNVRYIPVVNRDGKLIGLVGQKSLLRILLSETN
jgi:CBS domain-containing protein